MNEKAMEVWLKAWAPETHETDYAKKRIESAKSAKLTPVQINQEDLYGYFQGSSGRYETFLDSCPCIDFHRSKLPCKHVYRLAMELGVLNAQFKTDAKQIVTPKQDKMPLDKAIDIVEGLRVDVQARLLDMTVKYETGQKQFGEPLDSQIKALLESGLVVYASEETRSILDGPVYVIKNTLNLLGVSYDKKMKAADLKKYCAENLSEVIPPIVMLTFPNTIPVRNIHLYLHRKDQICNLYDLDHWKALGFSSAQLQLPIDTATDQLVKRGYYKP